jgi:hypothetical protein
VTLSLFVSGGERPGYCPTGRVLQAELVGLPGTFHAPGTLGLALQSGIHDRFQVERFKEAH